MSVLPTTWTIDNPDVPFTKAFAEPIRAEHMISINGIISERAVRFSINFICGLSSDCDVAFHLNPRFDEFRLVRNTRINGIWGPEEACATQRFSLKRGEKFSIDIYVTETNYLVSINGIHFCIYEHRIPIWQIHAFSVYGDVEIHNYTVEANVKEYLFDKYREKTISVLPIESMNSYLTNNFSSLKFSSSPVLSNINLNVGSRLDIVGKVKILPHSFYINLQSGNEFWPRPDILFHFNPRFFVRNKDSVIRNSKISGIWGQEEKDGSIFPIRPGLCFMITIICENNSFKILINDILYTEFKYRSDISLINTILIEGDILIRAIFLS